MSNNINRGRRKYATNTGGFMRAPIHVRGYGKPIPLVRPRKGCHGDVKVTKEGVPVADLDESAIRILEKNKRDVERRRWRKRKPEEIDHKKIKENPGTEEDYSDNEYLKGEGSP